jgi:hypothetical protein
MATNNQKQIGPAVLAAGKTLTMHAEKLTRVTKECP